MLAIGACLLACGVAASDDALPEEGDDDHPPVTADALLDDVLRRFPREPLVIDGELIVRGWRGVEHARYAFDMRVDWGATPSRLRYTVRDGLGAVLDEARIVMRSGVPAAITAGHQAAGTGGATIGVSDLTRTDLAMAYLWWRGGRIVGEDRTKGRDCYLVEVPAPAGAAGAGAAYAGVRLWIDRKLHMMLRAEGLDAGGRTVREMWVRSLKKIDGQWVIKDLEVQDANGARRTRIRVNEVRDASPP